MKVAAALAVGQTKLAENAEVRKLSEAIRQRAVEIAELKDKLKMPHIETNVQAVPKGAKQKAQTMAATAVPTPGSAVTAETPATESPTRKQPEVEGPTAESATAEAPVVEESVADPPEAEAPRIEEPAAEPPRTEELPWTAEQLGFSLEKAAEQAEFHLASEGLVFQRAARDVRSEDTVLIDAAMENLRRIRNPAVTRVLGLLARDPRAEVRARALTTLTEQQDEGAVPLFQQAVNDSSARVRMAALRGLYRLGDGAAIPYLIKALEDEDAGVRRRAVTCLAWAGVQEALPNLLLLLEDPDTAVRKAVVDALADLKSELAVPGLIQALEDEDVRVRRAANKTLKNLTHRTVVFSPGASRQEEAEAKARWKAWWRANKATFRVG